MKIEFANNILVGSYQKCVYADHQYVAILAIIMQLLKGFAARFPL